MYTKKTQHNTKTTQQNTNKHKQQQINIKRNTQKKQQQHNKIVCIYGSHAYGSHRLNQWMKCGLQWDHSRLGMVNGGLFRYSVCFFCFWFLFCFFHCVFLSGGGLCLFFCGLIWGWKTPKTQTTTKRHKKHMGGCLCFYFLFTLLSFLCFLFVLFSFLKFFLQIIYIYI